MKTILKLALAVAAFIAPAGTHGLLAQVDTCNYVITTTHLLVDSTLAARRVVSYYDGLGRPVQTLHRAGAGNGDDLVDRTEYDSLGRAYRSWNTVAVGTNGGREVGPAMIATYAQQYYSDNNAYTLTEYDGSPLDRIRKVTGPGAAWHTNGKGVTSGYLTNVGSGSDASLQCVKYAFSLSGNTGISFSRDGLWPAGALSVQKTEDEDGRTLWVFKDMRDLTILERRLAEEGSGNNPAVYADIHYLYDDVGRLTAVLPPELSKHFAQGSWSGSTGSDPKVEGFAYQYRYDERGRMIAKKIPGADWIYYIYDEGDRVVLTQDGNQREKNEWSFRLQDALGRECLTGTMTRIYDAFSSPLALEQVMAIRDRTSGTYDNLHGYTVEGLSIPSDAAVLMVNWWDDYSFLGHEPGMSGTEYGYSDPSSGSGYGIRYGTDARGYLTGHWGRAIGEAPSAWTQTGVCETWYYDDRGRTVRHVKGYPSGSRITEQSGYAFSGELTALGRTTSLSNDTSRTEEYVYTYDAWGRPLATTHSLDGGTPLLLTSNTYDSVGRLSQTLRGGASVQNSPSALASNYTYNVRDWLTEIDGSLFTEIMTYEAPRANSLPNQWSGNISGIQWGDGESQPYHYDFTYDLLGRLTAATYGGSTAALNHSRTYSYDLNGNMTQRKAQENANLNYGAWLEWTWNSGAGNRPETWHQQRNLMSQMPGMPSGPTQVANEYYAYDASGNRTVVMDVQGDTLNVMRYNLLNLPEEFVTAEGDSIRYVYNADGEKLFVQEVPAIGSPTGTEYVANYRIENDTLTMIHTDAGYYTIVTPPAGVTGPVYAHIWYLKDHLGNNRVLADASGSALRTHHYDPFGEEFAVNTNTSPAFPAGMTESPYKYGDKEWNSTTSTYDFEARQLAPAFHRFTTMDPLVEKYYGISPYAYCADNPLNRIDLSGQRDTTFISGVDKPISEEKGTKTPLYNCHSFAWEESEGDPLDIRNYYVINVLKRTKWDNSPDNNMSGFKQLDKNEPNVKEDRVLYYVDIDKNGKYDKGEPIAHSAVVFEVDNNGYSKTVISKMGADGISINHPDAPSFYKTFNGEATSRAYFRYIGKGSAPKVKYP